MSGSTTQKSPLSFERGPRVSIRLWMHVAGPRRATVQRGILRRAGRVGRDGPCALIELPVADQVGVARRQLIAIVGGNLSRGANRFPDPHVVQFAIPTGVPRRGAVATDSDRPGVANSRY